MAIAVTLHVLAVVVWVGGMFFAHLCLRPVAVARLEPPLRLPLWEGVFGRFFPWVWIAIATLWATGLWMLFTVFGGFRLAALYILLMLALGLVMSLIFTFIYFVPYQGLKASVAAGDWPGAGAQLARIRPLVGTNLVLGLVTTLVATAGRWLVPG